jgi:hypothetical protein
MKFIASALMGALFSYANSLELSTKLTTEQVNPTFCDGPILMQPTAWDPLSYHGTYVNNGEHKHLHAFWEYPQSAMMPN